MAKKPRSAAKQQSDAVYNQRRRAKRALARMMRETGGNLTAAQRGYKKSLEQQIAATYIGHRPDAERKASAVRAADLLGQRVAGNKASAAERRDIMFRSQFGSVSRKGASIGGMTAARNKIFMRATQAAWAGRGPDRLKSIADYYGKPIDEVYRLVMARQGEALRREYRIRTGKSGGATDDPRNKLQVELAENVDRDMGSPDYMVYVVAITPDMI